MRPFINCFTTQLTYSSMSCVLVLPGSLTQRMLLLQNAVISDQVFSGQFHPKLEDQRTWMGSWAVALQNGTLPVKTGGRRALHAELATSGTTTSLASQSKEWVSRFKLSPTLDETHAAHSLAQVLANQRRHCMVSVSGCGAVGTLTPVGCDASAASTHDILPSLLNARVSGDWAGIHN